MRIVICDDQALVREGLEMLLSLDDEIEVVAIAEDGYRAVELAAEHNPDLILMDLKMPVMNGIDATREILKENSAIKVLVLTTYDHDEWLFDALRAGASGYLLKDAKREEIISAIKGTLAGETYLDPKVAGKVIGQVSKNKQVPSAKIKKYSVKNTILRV